MIKGKVKVVSDKSISHRALILASVANGNSRIENCSDAEDVRRTLIMLRKLGINIKTFDKNCFFIYGKGLNGFKNIGKEKRIKKNKLFLYAGNSGTSARLMIGLLAGAGVKAVVYGDESLSERPMGRVTDPLVQMGAKFKGNEKLPIEILRGTNRGINFNSKVPSAQVKSSLLLAGLFSDETVSISENISTRNHTEVLLKHMHADISSEGNTIKMKGNRELKPLKLKIPGDFSAAAYFITLAAISEDADIVLNNVGLNTTRTAFLDVIRDMGANVKVSNISDAFERRGSLRVSSSSLSGISINNREVSLMIDEIPVLAAAAALASGKTVVKGAGELRKKESDRINAIVGEFRKLGIKIQETDDGFVIYGENRRRLLHSRENFKKASDHGDHRIAMTLAVLEMAVFEKISKRYESVKVSYPDFYADMAAVYLQGKLQKPIILTGFMGAGKTTVGRKLAKKLALKFYDIDKGIEEKCNKNISEIFAEHGEKGFRKTESAIFKDCLIKRKCVISTGGGTLLLDENLKIAEKTGEIFVLEPELEFLKIRLMKENKRPAIRANTREEKEKLIEELYMKRIDKYNRIAGKSIKSKTVDEACRNILYELAREFGDWFSC